MTSNAEVIRGERFLEIGRIIQRDITLLTERWSRRAMEEQPTARRVHHEVLLNELPLLLAELGKALAEAGEPYTAPHCQVARAHAEQRWETGWSLAEVIRDYRIMRLVLLDYLDECLDRSLSLLEIQAVGLALDEAIEASVQRYVYSREKQLQQLEETVRARETALREADQRKNEFLATLAHELRNPLAPLRTALEVLRLEGDSPASIRQVREIMERQVQQMTRLLEDLLDVSRIAQGKLVLRKAPLDLRGVLEQALQTSAPLLESHKHQLFTQFPTEPLGVVGDRSRLIQIFVNLLNNAAKYTPDKGKISLTAVREDAAVVVRLQDNGRGILPEMIPHIFELFTQLDIGEDRPEDGLGIGLTLVRRLVELHGGTITVTSPGLGQGSEFVVRLPLAAASAVESTPAPVDKPAPVGRHVLIVEDHRDARESLAMLLRLLGHRVELAEEGNQGVEVALAVRPEVILIDIGLPGLDGYEVATRVRVGLGQGVVLIALTGYGQPSDRQRALQAGFNAHLTKPLELEELYLLLGCSASGQ